MPLNKYELANYYLCSDQSGKMFYQKKESTGVEIELRLYSDPNFQDVKLVDASVRIPSMESVFGRSTQLTVQRSVESKFDPTAFETQLADVMRFLTVQKQ